MTRNMVGDHTNQFVIVTGAGQCQRPFNGFTN